jgi:D-alanine-D-alanine ligase
MTNPERVRLIVLFGGQSAEHDVSCVTAAHVLRAVDTERYDVVPVGITREGTWVAAEEAAAALARGAGELPNELSATGTALDPVPTVAVPSTGQSVVVLPLLHGPHGEDGTVQGLLELAGVPYVGPGVLASALCMDKVKAKEVLAANGLPQAPWLALRDNDIDDEGRTALAAVEREGLGYPVFVKPANMGSSVGVSKVKAPEDLAAAVNLAAEYDEWIVVEEGITAREIEVAVLGNVAPQASVPGEIVASHEFYDYEDKYLAGTSELLIPAPLSSEDADEVRELAIQAFEVLRCDGMARADFLFEEGGRGFLVNELNTIPGFTPISMYPKLWEASGLPYPELIDELIRLAIERHDRRSRFSTKR